MLKILEKLAKKRSLTLLILFFPIPYLLLNVGDLFVELPKSPFIYYDIEFIVPGRMASEIEDKVTSVAERNFNGLPRLVSLESVTENEKSKIELIFNVGTDPNRALLFIQEKMDRLKLILPSDVKNTKIHYRQRKLRPDLIVKNLESYPYDFIKNSLNELNPLIQEINPPLDQDHYFAITVDVKKMKKNDVSLDQFNKALKVNGLVYRLGEAKDLSYKVDGTFNNIEDLRRVAVGGKEHKVIHLREVADIKLIHPSPVKGLEITLNHSKTSVSEFESLLIKALPKAQMRAPYRSFAFSLLKAPFLLFILLSALQMLLFWLLFKHPLASFSTLVFNGSYAIQYFFWIYVLHGEISALDLPGYFLGMIMGMVLWSSLLARIRIYFLPSKLDHFIQRSLEQARLFSLVEYGPSIIMLFILAAITSLPLLISNINVISKYILIDFLFVSFPIIIALLVIIAIFSPLDWIKSPTDTRLGYKENFLTSKLNITSVLFIALIAFSSPFLWKYLPLGLEAEDRPSLQKWRGHGKDFTYYNLNPEKDYRGFGPLDDWRPTQEFLYHWTITPSGLKQLVGKDLNSFQLALEDMALKKEWGVWEDRGSRIPLVYERIPFNKLSFGELMIGSLKQGENPIPLKIVTNKKIKKMPNKIIRGQLTPISKGTFDRELTGGNFFYTNTIQQFIPSSMTRYFKKELEQYVNNHWTVVVFLLVILSLYLNSFFRGGILTLFSLSCWKLLGVFKAAIGSNFHTDSLWISFVPLWITLTVIILLSRTCDIDRLRGSDKSKSLEQMAGSLSQVMFFNIIFFSLSLFIWWPCELLWGTTVSQSLTRELAYCAVVSLVSGLFAYFYLFRIYYNTCEEWLDSVTFKVMRFVFGRKNKRVGE